MRIVVALLMLVGTGSVFAADACYNFINKTNGRPKVEFQYPPGLIGNHVASITLDPGGQYKFCDSASIYKNGNYVRAVLTGGRWGNNNGGPVMGSDAGASPVGDYTIINNQAAQAGGGPGAWYGFSNSDNIDQDKNLAQNCRVNFSRIATRGDAHQNIKFTDLCASIGKRCVKVCDWEGHEKSCDEVSQWDNQFGGGQVGKRDGSRVALCQ
jgi:hypothetical protein